MDLELAERLLKSNDASHWASAARDLGRNLAAQLDRDGKWLLQFRRLAATARLHAGKDLGKDLQASKVQDFKRGFLEGLELVATGFERQLKDTKAEQAELATLRARSNWFEILKLIQGGVVLPSDLADKRGVTCSRMTAVIDELEDVGLVLQASVGNTRPCRLTARAQRLLTKLSPPEPHAGNEAPTTQVAAVGEFVDRAPDDHAGNKAPSTKVAQTPESQIIQNHPKGDNQKSENAPVESGGAISSKMLSDTFSKKSEPPPPESKKSEAPSFEILSEQEPVADKFYRESFFHEGGPPFQPPKHRSPPRRDSTSTVSSAP